MLARCWLHIGTEKTGTTSIQEFLAENRPKLSEQSYIFPLAPGGKNHIGLTCYSLDDGKVESIRRALGVTRPEDISRYRSTLRTSLEKEVNHARASNLILSNEHLSSRLDARSEIHRIKALCDALALRTTVIVYLRNQVDFLVSRYIEAVKGGSTAPFPFPVGRANARLMDYALLLAPWREAFGVKNMVVRRYEAGDFPNGELLLDFAAQAGIDVSDFQFTAHRNESLDALHVAFLREFNRHVPHVIDGHRNAMRGRVVQDLEGVRRGERFLVGQTVADAIEAQFRSSNEKVAVEYFGSRFSPLFGKARSVGPDNSCTSGEIGANDAVCLAAQLWLAQQRRLIRLERGAAQQPAKSPRADIPNLDLEPASGDE